MWCENVDWSDIEAYWKHSNLSFNDVLTIAVNETIDETISEVAKELGYQAGKLISETINEKI